MKSELIVDVQSSDITIALTEDDRLMEWGQESCTEATYAVGNIYYGRVKKVLPALNAVFVDVGHEKEAFLHYLDLGSQFLTLEKFTQFAVQEKNRKPLLHKTPKQKEVGKQGSIQDVCRVGQEILVQVTKEPINTKGPRLTAEISLAGRNIVLIPFGEKVMVSSKIRSEAERSRLKQLVQAIKPERFGVIVRTVAEGKRAAELDAELRLLVRRWEETVARLQKAKPTSLVTEEIGRTIGMIRDVFTPDFTAIHVNDPEMYQEVKSYVGLIAPESEKIVKMYSDDQPIFDHFGITRQMKTGLGRTVGFKNGGYLIMERTEALFSIDVNSGSKKLGADQEDNAFQCNMLAADEIYHQLRLRDIGGIIIVDFIDMNTAEHRQLLYEHMKRLMKRDRARHNVLQLSKFGLMQITRQRVRPVVEVDVQEQCPTCGGIGKVQPSILFTDTLDEQIELYKSHFGRGMKLYVHPFVYAYADKGLLSSLRFRWFRKYGVRLRANESLALLDYRFFDRNGQPLELPRMTEDSIDKKAEKKAKLYTAQTIEEKPEVVLPQPKKEKKDEAKEQPKASTTVQEVKNVAEVATPMVEPAAAEQAPAKPKKKRSRKKKEKDYVILDPANAAPERTSEAATADAAPELTLAEASVATPKVEANTASDAVPETSKAASEAAPNAASEASKASVTLSEDATKVRMDELKAPVAESAKKTRKRPAKKAKEMTQEVIQMAENNAVEAVSEAPAELANTLVVETKKTRKRPSKMAKEATQESAPNQEDNTAPQPAEQTANGTKLKQPKQRKKVTKKAAPKAAASNSEPKADAVATVADVNAAAPGKEPKAAEKAKAAPKAKAKKATSEASKAKSQKASPKAAPDAAEPETHADQDAEQSKKTPRRRPAKRNNNASQAPAEQSNAQMANNKESK